MSSTKKEAALAWAARGFRVFPLHVGAKEPVHKGWTEWATSDPALVATLWTDASTGEAREYNIGVLTNDMVVVDVDVKNGKNGKASFQALGLPQDTLVVLSPSGGLHVYYSGPNKSLSAGALGDGLDIRSYHGYVIAPGSELDPVWAAAHNTAAGAYVLAQDRPVLPAPVSLLERLSAPSERRSADAVVDLDSGPSVLAAVDYLLSAAPLSVEGAGGDATAFQVAARLKDFGVSEPVAVRLLLDRWNDRCAPPWSLEEIEAKVRNAYEYGANSPGSAAPAAMVQGLNIPVPPADALPAPPESRQWLNHGDPWRLDVPWLFYRMLPQTGVGLLVAPSQAGKTFLLMELARALYRGVDFFGTPPDDPGGTIFLYSGTEGSGFAQRLQALQEKTPLSVAATMVNDLAVRGALETLEADLRFKMAEMLREFGVPVRLIVLETLSASGLLPEENDNAAAARAMSALGGLANRLGLFVIVSHHPPKDGKGERGASAIRNNVDCVIEIYRDGQEKVRDLALTKARDTEQRDLGSFTLVKVVLGQDGRGREVSSLTISAAERALRGQRPATYGAVFSQVIQNCMADPATEKHQLDNGRLGILWEDALDLFRDMRRADGSRLDGSNSLKQFKAAAEWAQQLGTIDTVPFGRQRYLAPLTVQL